jgi:Fe-S oxidoreductase
MGWLPLWSRLASLAPGTVNAAGSSPGLSAALKRLAGIAPERTLPRFASSPFTRGHRGGNGPAPGTRPAVVLWPDTFNNYLTPGILDDARAVLDDAGFRVVLPRGQVCCGLTWITTGQLSVARRVLRHTYRMLRPYLEAGLPVVSLEPSCTATLRTDAVELLPGSAPARALADGTFTLAEFLRARASGWSPPGLDREAITQVHCHQHAVLGSGADEAVLALAGVRNTTLDSGCCGLAGNFGFERGHYQVSRAVGESRLLPAVRAAAPGTLVVADGFSCRTQIAQEAGREAVHLAQVLRMAMRRGEVTADSVPAPRR